MAPWVLVDRRPWNREGQKQIKVSEWRGRGKGLGGKEGEGEVGKVREKDGRRMERELLIALWCMCAWRTPSPPKQNVFILGIVQCFRQNFEFSGFILHTFFNVCKFIRAINYSSYRHTFH